MEASKEKASLFNNSIKNKTKSKQIVTCSHFIPVYIVKHCNQEESGKKEITI